MAFKQSNVLFHSLIAKLIGLITLLALVIMVTLAIFKEFILANESRHRFFFLLFVVLLIFAFAIYFIHRLLLPVKKLTKGIAEISRGNLDVRIHVKSTDELGLLAKAFNQMAKDLGAMIQAKEQLLLDVSHEIRTPITRAKLALEMVDESEYIITAKRNLREVEVMIRELLETQRLKSSFYELKISKIVIRDLMDQILGEYAGEASRINITPVSENLSIEADEDLIKIVIRNVINNALKYSLSNTGLVEISVVDNEDKIMISIEDAGTGIHPDEIEKVFEPFYRTDKARARKTGGYGLGLHLCKKIMGAHNGIISIRNKEGEAGIIVDIILNKKI